ncbi:MAG: M16 family metallopeptidase, partial [Pyrinomonadaceae bacterium]
MRDQKMTQHTNITRHKFTVSCSGLLLLTLMSLTSIFATSHETSGQQELPPKPAPPRTISFPKPVEKTLDNGLRVIAIERGSVPLVSAVLLVRSGGEVDPSALAGRANITATLLTEGGTKTRSAPELASQIDALGAEISANAAWDASTVRMSVMSSKFDKAMEIFSDVVRSPSFKQEEVDRVKRETIDDLTVTLTQPGSLASYVAARVLFGDGPYGHGLGGTPQSISQIKRDDLVQMHSNYYRPDNAVLVIGGALKAEQAIKIAERYFSDWVK